MLKKDLISVFCELHADMINKLTICLKFNENKEAHCFMKKLERRFTNRDLLVLKFEQKNHTDLILCSFIDKNILLGIINPIQDKLSEPIFIPDQAITHLKSLIDKDPVTNYYIRKKSRDEERWQR